MIVEGSVRREGRPCKRGVFRVDSVIFLLQIRTVLSRRLTPPRIFIITFTLLILAGMLLLQLPPNEYYQ
jgi:hypothetical protein